jgi:diguanylate cyclase (GGDEF)-like protein/PAS domain S-box-containing protein
MSIPLSNGSECDTVIAELAAGLLSSEDWDQAPSRKSRGCGSGDGAFNNGAENLRDDMDNTETINVSPLLVCDVGETGSFDLSGVVGSSFGKFLNALPIPVLVVARDGQVIFANDAYQIPYSEEHPITHRPFMSLFPKEKDSSAVESMMETVLTQRKQQVASITLTRGRSKLWGRMSMRPIRIGPDRFVLVVIEDRTAETREILLTKKNEEELEQRVKQRTSELLRTNALMKQEIADRKRAEAKLKLAAKIIESSTDAIFIMDVRGKIIDVNTAFTRISGYTKDEVVGKDFVFFANDRHDTHLYEYIWKTVLERGEWRGEVWDRTKEGQSYAKMLSISAVKNDKGTVSHCVGIFCDITRMKRDEERLQRMAHFDALTGLPNRVLFYDRVNQAILAAKRYKQVFAVILMDLDRFKNINDTLGHGFGDQVLITVAKRLVEVSRQSDTAARLGGDEFAVYLPRMQSSVDPSTFSERLLDRLSEPIQVNGREVVVSASIGIALYPDDGDQVELLLQNADTAMYRAKESGKNNYKFFSKDMNARVLKRLELESALREALSQNKLLLHYQPMIDLNSMSVMGMEALLRRIHPSGSVISAGEFIPVAEETGLIGPIGEWALRSACRQGKKWQEMGLPPVPVSVNVSGTQLRHNDFVSAVLRILDETKLDPKCLEIELTESVMMDDFDEAIKKFVQFKLHGIRVSLDDFGTGYSSLSYLRRFPISKLKIDQSFIGEIAHPYEQELVKSILAVAHSRSLTVIAEGVESEEQVKFLREHGCDGAQGYFFSRPVPAEQVTALLKNNGFGKPLPRFLGKGRSGSMLANSQR